MAIIFMDGFDKYGGVNTNSTIVPALLTAGEWSTAGAVFINPSLSLTPGFGLGIAGNNAVSKTFPATYARLIGGFRFNSTSVAGCGIRFSDGATAQGSVTIDNTGTISVIRGPINAPVAVLTSSAPVLIANNTYHLEFDISFTNAGPYTVWIDGVQVLTGTGDITVTANNFVNTVAFAGNTSSSVVFDDFYLFDTTGTTNNAVLGNAPRIETTFPISDSAVQFTFGAATLGPTTRRSAAFASHGANAMYLLNFTPVQNCTLNSISLPAGATSATLNIRPLVYSDVAGVPTTLLSTGTTVTGITNGATTTMPLTTPQNLIAGTQYWLGFMNDIAVTNAAPSYDGGTAGRTASSTFASGAPGTAPVMATGGSILFLWGNVTGTGVNWYEIAPNPRSNPPPPVGLAFVGSANVGDEDLYGFSPLSVTPLNVYATAVKAYIGKSDSGIRTVSVHLKSGAVDSAGPAYAPLTTYNWTSAYYERNPDGNVAWTPTTLNAAISGFKIDT